MATMRRLTVLAGAAEAARRYIRNNPDKVNRFADRAGRLVDERTKGKYHRQIDNAVRKIRSSTNNPGYRRH
jgi:MT0933-like antitoxin protein